LNFEQEGDQVALMLSIPVIRAKDEEEIEAALEKARAESSEEENSEGIVSENNKEEENEFVADDTADDEEESDAGKVSAPERMNTTPKSEIKEEEETKEECTSEK